MGERESHYLRAELLDRVILVLVVFDYIQANQSRKKDD